MIEPLLVFGASDQLGQRVLHHFVYTPEFPRGAITAATRTPQKLTRRTYRGVATRHSAFADEGVPKDAFSPAHCSSGLLRH